ncbi:MAG TPA: long-chain fatty acid--CoA ligase [Actinomycetota bacterium]|nr:long-chain fatty acid--CoA ligase [Actinomycetota bacterium]
MSVVSGATLVELFTNRITASPSSPAMRTKSGDTWSTMTWAEVGAQVADIANGLLSLGVEAGSCVSLLSRNRPEWIIADLAVQLCGAATAPVYVTNSPRQVGHVIGDSESTVAIVEDAAQLGKVAEVRDRLPKLAHVVVITGEGSDNNPGVLSWGELRRRGQEYGEANPAELKARMAAVKPEDTATVIYTSGTTGEPKGVMLSHANATKTVGVNIAVMHLDTDQAAHRMISYLPLSHVFERLMGEWGGLSMGAEIWFAESVEKLVSNLKDCRPTLFGGVPRVYEKFYTGVQANIAKQSAVKKFLINKAVATGKERVSLTQAGKPIPPGLAKRHKRLDHLVLSKLRHELGMDACVIAVTGGAPISTEVLAFVHSLGINLVEGYGLTETTAPLAVNPADRPRIGTVGPPIPGVEVRFDEDGELLVKGFNVFQGYFHNDAATSAAMTADGFFRTGDVGRFDEAGYVCITDRKKDILVTAGGKNVAPQVLEEKLKFDPLISQALVVGDRRPYLVALITLDAEVAPKWAADHGLGVSDPEALATNQTVLDAVGAAVGRLNQELSKAEGIKKWAVLPKDFTQDAEEITPTLKVRRKIIMEKYAADIERLYS